MRLIFSLMMLDKTIEIKDWSNGMEMVMKWLQKYLR